MKCAAGLGQRAGHGVRRALCPVFGLGPSGLSLGSPVLLTSYRLQAQVVSAARPLTASASSDLLRRVWPRATRASQPKSVASAFRLPTRTAQARRNPTRARHSASALALALASASEFMLGDGLDSSWYVYDPFYVPELVSLN